MHRDFPRLGGILFATVWVYDEVELSLFRRAKKWIAKRVVNSGPFSTILCLDGASFDWFRTVKKTGRVRIGRCPDPVEQGFGLSRTECRKRLYLPETAKIVGCIGGINERRGVDLLIKAFCSYGPRIDEYMLLVGKQNETIAALIEKVKQKNPAVWKQMRVVNRFVNKEELLVAINAADVIAATYPCHPASASIVIRAATANKPVLGSNRGWVGYVVRKFGLGFCCDVNSNKEFERGLRWAFCNPQIDVSGAKRLARANTIPAFQAVMKDLLDVGKA